MQDTGDTRESSSIYLAKFLLEEGARLVVYDPKVTKDQVMRDLKAVVDDNVRVEQLVTVADDAYTAVDRAHAFVVCTEWDEFKVYQPTPLNWYHIVL